MICPYCENEIPDNVPECPECGSKISAGLQFKEKDNGIKFKREIEEDIKEIKEKTAKRQKVKWSIFGTVILIIVVIYGYNKYADISTMNIMKKTIPAYYETFNTTFENPNWKIEGKDEILFSGKCLYNNMETDFSTRFKLVISNGDKSFEPQKVNIDRFDYNNKDEIRGIMNFILSNAGTLDWDWWDYFINKDSDSIEDDDAESNYDEDNYDEDNYDEDSYEGAMSEETESSIDEATNMEFVYYDALDDYSLNMSFDDDEWTSGEYSFHSEEYDEESDSESTFDSYGRISNGVLKENNTSNEYKCLFSYVDDHYEITIYGILGQDLTLYEKSWADENAG